MGINPREPSDEEREVISQNVEKMKVTLPGKDNEYRIDYSMSLESRVTTEASFKKRTEKITCSHEDDVIFFTVISEAKGTAEKKAELPAPLLAEVESRKPCVFFNKGTCRGGIECKFSHNYIKPKVYKK